ncbi:class I SAM-dependent methyltransferase [Methanoculleus bourgensis]|uniref:class I SAM-dependent methyltransferase n=1 Tax=Methanoculleus bourgensis TaxID=83986 RepID=UPI0022EEBF2E|nr:class I SAM-dependent methyltransferase [Methanoculleus bourgensis]GLI47654.1 SAM-dependent methyltransferase [Methanoculleus bourgensis]
MTLSEDQIKGEIAKRWDYSSQRYDAYHGHGIKSDEEVAFWKALFGRIIPGERLNVLDVGCGTGEISLLLAGMGHRVTGIDLSKKMLDRAASKAKAMAQAGHEVDAKFMIGDAESPPFENGSFDAIVTRHVLWTLPNPQNAVTGWKRALKEGGTLGVIDGLWNDGSLETRLRRKVGNLLILIVERNDISRDSYSPEMNATLPHSKGVSAATVREYMEKAGLRDIGTENLADLIEIQRRHMPFRYKISYKYNYYAVYGTK